MRTNIRERERENERTGIAEEVVTLEVVAEVEDVVEVVLELNLDVVDPIAGDRILERIPGIKPAVVDVAGVFLSLSFPAGCVGVGTVGFVSKKSKRPYISLNSKMGGGRQKHIPPIGNPNSGSALPSSR